MVYWRWGIETIIERCSHCYDFQGRFYQWEFKVEKVENVSLYPEGIKAIFRLLRINGDGPGKDVLVLLIDNHSPFGFHEHDKLPKEHDSRLLLNIRDWKEALYVFQQRCQEILK